MSLPYNIIQILSNIIIIMKLSLFEISEAKQEDVSSY